MKLPVLILFLGTFVFSQLISAQSIYGITSNKDVVKISVDGCFSEVVLNGADLNPDPGLVTDIAYEQGVLYGALGSYICIIHPENGSVESINTLPLLDLSGLTGDQNGNLYLAGTDVARYIIATGILESIGSLYPYHTSGDVEYVNGSLYVTAVNGNGENSLLKVETDPFSFSVIGSIPADCYGLVKSNELDPEYLYITDYNILYSININNGFITAVCNSNSEVSGIYGLTSGPEDLTPIDPSADISSFPNVFSPNGDQKNDLFTFNTGNKKGSITISNRWGNVVYYSNLPFSWDGKTSNGQECTEGVYYYIFNSESESKTGIFHLLR
ncbi:MAG: gliding motility-associated C-terminal domain-containing protein [Bacteroidota bacterium]